MTPGPRLFLDAAHLTESLKLPIDVELNGDEAHYLRNVLRLKLGDPLEVGDRHSGVVCRASVTTLNRDRVSVTLSHLIQTSELDRAQADVILLCGLLKGDKSELICDWGTELGCSQIHLWQSMRSVVRLKGASECSLRAARLNKIVTAAAQQSRRSKPPRLGVHLDLTSALEAIADMDSAAKYLCSLDRDLPLLSDAIKDTAKTDKVILVVGPEGDVAPEEVSLLVERYKFIKVSLGAGVLRSELAVVAGVVLAREHAAKPFNFRLIGESSRSE